ncbi:hypothetical protein D3C72_1022050 [compost metagenome]
MSNRKVLTATSNTNSPFSKFNTPTPILEEASMSSRGAFEINEIATFLEAYSVCALLPTVMHKHNNSVDKSFILYNTLNYGRMF